MFLITILLSLFLIIPSVFAQTMDKESECLQNGQVPIWVTINPNDPTKTLYQGELVSFELLLGKPGDGSAGTCMYIMKSKTNPLETWTCIGFSNSERLARQK
jgi:hypothetical protein